MLLLAMGTRAVAAAARGSQVTLNHGVPHHVLRPRPRPRLRGWPGDDVYDTMSCYSQICDVKLGVCAIGGPGIIAGSGADGQTTTTTTSSGSAGLVIGMLLLCCCCCGIAAVVSEPHHHHDHHHTHTHTHTHTLRGSTSQARGLCFAAPRP